MGFVGADGEEGGAPHWMDTLVDVLLALLAPTSTSLPSAPLREAVEHVFRVFCDQLTPTGASWGWVSRGAIISGGRGEGKVGAVVLLSLLPRCQQLAVLHQQLAATGSSCKLDVTLVQLC